MKTARCPICDREVPADGAGEFPHRPFCSARCRRIDLGRWLGETYRIPSPDSSVLSDDGLGDEDGPSPP